MMTGGAEARTARTRERILTAAIELFLENGFHGTNIDSVASRSRSSKQTIYKYYNDKEAILEQAIERLGDEISDHELELDHGSDDFETQLTEFGLHFLDAILMERQMRTYRLCVELARNNNIRSETYWVSESEKLQATLSEYIRQLSARGVIPYQDDFDFMAHAYMGMLRGNYHYVKALDGSYAPSSKEIAAHAKQVTNLFCAQLRHPPI